MTLPFKDILCCDYETFYSADIGFSKQAMTEYVRDPQWETQTCAAKFIGSTGRPEVWVGHDEIARNLRAVDWSKTAMLAHHAHFEGLISTHHFGVYPCFWLDTMSMVRFIHGVDVSCGLDATAKRMGFAGKVHGDALTAVKGTRLADMPVALLEKLCEYNGDDVEDTINIFNKLYPLMPENELKLIDITVRMYAEPTMLLDGKKLRDLYESEIVRKKGVLDRLAVPLAETLRAKLEAQEAKYSAYEAKGKSYKKPRLTRDQMLMKEFGSADMFALHLEEAGVEVPTKISPRTGLPAPAFAQNDLEFQELAEHPTELVRDLVEARLMSKSNIVQTRAGKLMGRANYPTPIYLAYCAARTQRWGGGDSVNWQNPPKRGPGAAIRHALMAPPGTKMIIADAAQIEARMNAWKAKQTDKLEAFAKYDRGEGPDIYCVAASGMYHRVITRDDKDERFGGKVLELSGGYGAGYIKINHTFRVGQFGPPVYQTLDETEQLVIAWRKTNDKIHAQHKIHERSARIAFLGQRELEDGPIIFEGGKRGGYIHGPHGGYMFYPNLTADETGEMWYQSKNGPVKLWSGQITENCAAGDTLVMTQRGWIELQSVTSSDLVHDGVEFVKHAGLLDKGVQDCTAVDGVYMTPDHKVLTDDGWKAAETSPRPYRPDLRHVDGVTIGARSWKTALLDILLRVWKRMREGRYRGNESRQEGADAELWVLDEPLHRERQPHTRYDESSGVLGMALDARPLQATYASGMEKLRRTRDICMQALEHVREFLGGHGQLVSAGANAGSEEQQRPVLSGELSVGHVRRASAESPQYTKSKSGHTEQRDRNRADNTALPLQPRAVFDIANCGPRHRFVVKGKEGPFIVHNCIQFLARILLGQQMVRIQEEFPEARIVMSTHDEVGIIIEARKAERMAARVKQIMSTPEDWCEGIPLNADVQIDTFYSKT